MVGVDRFRRTGSYNRGWTLLGGLFCLNLFLCEETIICLLLCMHTCWAREHEDRASYNINMYIYRVGGKAFLSLYLRIKRFPCCIFIMCFRCDHLFVYIGLMKIMDNLVTFWEVNSRFFYWYYSELAMFIIIRKLCKAYELLVQWTLARAH